MAVPSESSWAHWRWALLLVVSLHLLSTSGTWWITDHGETLAAAHQFLKSGRLDLQGLGPGWEEWSKIAVARHSTTTRFLPLSILSLAPFLLIDHAFGWRNPEDLRFVHLQGHFFVGLALLLAGRFVARSTASASSAALCVLLAGLNWPVWMIARRLGPEPILLALVAAFVTSGPGVRFACLLLLPWVHASGPLLGLGALLWLAIEEGSWTSRAAVSAAVGLLAGSLSVALLWNLPVHGHALLGGYDSYRGDSFFTLRNPLFGTVTLLAQVVIVTLPLAYLTWRGGTPIFFRAFVLALPSAAFFGAFSSPEPVRRLAPLMVAWAVLATARMSPSTPNIALPLALVSLASGVFGLASDFVAFTETPLGVFSGPHLLFLRMAFEEGRPWLAGSVVTLLTLLAFVAASKTLRLLVRPEPAVGSNSVPRPESKS